MTSAALCHSERSEESGVFWTAKARSLRLTFFADSCFAPRLCVARAASPCLLVSKSRRKTSFAAFRAMLGAYAPVPQHDAKDNGCAGHRQLVCQTSARQHIGRHTLGMLRAETRHGAKTDA